MGQTTIDQLIVNSPYKEPPAALELQPVQTTI